MINYLTKLIDFLYPARPKVRASTFGSPGEVKRISNCKHSWVAKPSILFGYMKVNKQCALCKTWKGK